MRLISDELGTDDGLYILTTDNRNLEALIELGALKKRIYKSGKTLLKLEQLLAHKIYPYNPYLGEQKQLIKLPLPDAKKYLKNYSQVYN